MSVNSDLFMWATRESAEKRYEMRRIPKSYPFSDIKEYEREKSVAPVRYHITAITNKNGKILYSKK